MAVETKKKIELEIAHVLFIDIVGYSKLSINEQHAAVDELTRIVRGKHADPDDREHNRPQANKSPDQDFENQIEHKAISESPTTASAIGVSKIRFITWLFGLNTSRATQSAAATAIEARPMTAPTLPRFGLIVCLRVFKKCCLGFCRCLPRARF